MIAIITKFIGPTEHKPARIKADAGSGRTLTITYDHESTEQAHRDAAERLADKYGWRYRGLRGLYELLAGGLDNGNYAFVFHSLKRDYAADAMADALQELVKISELNTDELEDNTRACIAKALQSFMDYNNSK